MPCDARLCFGRSLALACDRYVPAAPLASPTGNPRFGLASVAALSFLVVADLFLCQVCIERLS